MGHFAERLFRLFGTPASVEDLSRQMQDLRHTLNSAVQDIQVMKNVLEEKGLMDAALYKRLRIIRMVNNHSSAGARSWKNYSLYPYTLEETDFLRDVLQASEAEVKNFEENVEFAGTQT